MDKEKEVTIYDLAKSLDLSIATVSRALKGDPVVNKKTKKRITDLAEQLNYRTNHFAKNLRTHKSNTIGVIIPRLNSYFMSTVIAGMESVANQAGYNLIISQSAESLEQEINSAQTMFRNRVDGLLVSLAYGTTNLDHFNLFLQKKIPLIFFDRSQGQSPYTKIVLDNEKAAFDATTHLIEQGCKRIVHITAQTGLEIYHHRLKGYQNALAVHNIDFDPDLIVYASLSMESGHEAAKKILSFTQMPDGIFAANDSAAVGCMIYLKQRGIRIPQDIAVAGFNNDPISIVIEPNLTSINYPGYKMGELAAGQLIGHLTGISSVEMPVTILIHHELMIRSSSLRK